MFSRTERQRIYQCGIAQLQAERATTPQRQIHSAFADITQRPFFTESVDILCDALTLERCARLNETEAAHG